MKLRLEPPQDFRPDEIYAKLVQIGAGKSDRDARQALAALALLLINHIADEGVLDEALAIVQNLDSEEGKVTVVAATRKFEKLSENQLGDGFMASPAASTCRRWRSGSAASRCICRTARSIFARPALPSATSTAMGGRTS